MNKNIQGDFQMCISVPLKVNDESVSSFVMVFIRQVVLGLGSHI